MIVVLMKPLVTVRFKIQRPLVKVALILFFNNEKNNKLYDLKKSIKKIIKMNFRNAKLLISDLK